MSEWPTHTLSELVQLETGKREKGGGKSSGEIISLGGEHITDSGQILTEAKQKYISREFYESLNQGRIKDGDVLMVKDGATTGKTAWVEKCEQPLAVNEHVFILRTDAPDRLCNGFLYFFLKSDSGQGQITKRFHGLIGGVTRPDVFSLKIQLPTLPEQKKIAQILSTVQRAIEAQDRIIQTTTELKKALMHKLFTKGLHDEPQKQTEIGPIPQSWELIRCEDACETISVGIVVKPTQYYVPNGVPALRSQNVRVDRMQMEPMVHISEEANDALVAKSKLRTGDVLIVRTGANLGMSCVLPAELDGCNCIDLLFIRTNPERLNGSFLSRFINSVEAMKQVGAGKTGMAQPHFNVGTVKRIFVSLPPLEEQEMIVSCLEKVDQKYDLAEAKMKVLQDLFRTLLHELMSAKVRVNNVAMYNGTYRSQ
jgi:type I restriction enzyme S subunit